MTDPDHHLAALKSLAAGPEAGALARAEQQLDDFLAEAGAPQAAAIALAALQGRFGRETAASPLRADILDAMSRRVVRLLEAGAPGA